MPNPAVCWHCGASLAELTPPFSRLDVCRACRADLHVCRMCTFHDLTVAKQCREPVAEEVRDKERANYCDYFVANPDAYRPKADSQASRAALDALFGQTAAAAPTTSAADQARAALDALFNKKS